MILFYPGPRPNTHCTEVNECMSLASIPDYDYECIQNTNVPL